MRLTVDGIHGNGSVHFDVLNTICGSANRSYALDLMCCEGSSTKNLYFEKKIFVDIQYRNVDRKKTDMQVVGDVFSFLHHDQFIYDVVFCLDGIEHLSKKDGYRLINTAQLAGEKVIFFTPLGEYIISDDEDPDHHHSGWLPGDFEELGYSTIVFPAYHELLNIGSFYAFKCDDMAGETERIFDKLISTYIKPVIHE